MSLRRTVCLASAYLILSACGSLAATPWYQTQIDEDMTSLVVKTSEGEQTIYTESHALLIGEVNYSAWPHLTAVPSELANLTKALERQHFKVELYFDLNSNDLMQVVDSFVRRKATIQDSRVFVYIAAHGESRDEGTPLGYLLPIDAVEQDAPKTDMAAKALSMLMFSAWAQSPDPRHMLFVFDSCFSGAFFGNRGQAVAPGPIGKTTGTPNAEGFAIGPDGKLVPPPPDNDGLESSDYALSGQPMSRGRQFLAAGDTSDTVPGKSVIAQLISEILDDKVSRAQMNADYWTTGDELGYWIERHAGAITRSLLKVPEPPNPVFGRIPDDGQRLYTKGDMIFSRLDVPDSPLVKSFESEWEKAIARTIDVAPVLVGNALAAEQKANAQVAELSRAASQQRAAADALQTKLDESTGLESGESEVFKQLQSFKELAKASEAQAKMAADASEAAKNRQKEILATAHDITSEIQSAINEAVPSKDAILDPEQEKELRSLIDAFSSTDTKIRRSARVSLEHFIGDLPPEKSDATVNILLTRMSEKSYRFQLGVAQAIGRQAEPLALADKDALVGELKRALGATAGRDPTLKGELQGALKTVEQARPLSR
ncbi:caspase family protein [Rhizobium leguminosarum]|uniref:caspase family protein n=1 Tax=Rhizobium leguminosarum TaxID=384 RepID=UPI00102FF05E|nr:caspase family protein [Rhizobium leguminosarum]TAY14025.1 caspase family protein [Rhizobium leguminosarum]